MPAELKDRFFRHTRSKWLTPNTDNKNYQTPGDEPGVYYITLCFYSLGSVSPENIVYVGSSTNLRVRYKSHQVFRKIFELYDKPIVRFYFLPMGKGFYDYEIKLIRKLSPPMNKNQYPYATKNPERLD